MNTLNVIRKIVGVLLISAFVLIPPEASSDPQTNLDEKNDAWISLLRDGEWLQLQREIQQSQREIFGQSSSDPSALIEIKATAFSFLQFWQEFEDVKPTNAQILSANQELLGESQEVLGAEHPATIRLMWNTARAHQLENDHKAALSLLERALDLSDKKLDDVDPLRAMVMSSLAEVNSDLARFAIAERLHLKALEISAEGSGPDALYSMIIGNRLADHYVHLGQYEEAEALYLKSSSAKLNVLLHPYRSHPVRRDADAGLGKVYARTNRIEEGERRLREVYSNYVDGHDQRHPFALEARFQALTAKFQDGQLSRISPASRQRIVSDLETGFERSVNSLGADHPTSQNFLWTLSDTYQHWGLRNRSEMGPLLEQALVTNTQRLGVDHPRTARAALKLAEHYAFGAFEFDAAERLYEQASASFGATFGLWHAEAILSKAKFANHLSMWSDPGDASKEIAEAELRKIIEGLYQRAQTYRSRAEQGSIRYASELASSYYLSLVSESASISRSMKETAILASQFNRSESAGNAIEAAGARLAAGSPEIESRLRMLGELQQQRSEIEASLIREQWRSSATLREVSSELADTDRKITEISSYLSEQFPDYAALSSANFLELGELVGGDSLLQPTEALISFHQFADLTGVPETWIAIVATDQDVYVVNLPKADEEVRSLAEEVRSSLELDSSGAPSIQFDFVSAGDLYVRLFSPLEPYLQGKTELLIIPDGPLQSIPLDLLVRVNPSAQAVLKGESDAQIEWFGDQFALTVLPSAISLRALRRSVDDVEGDLPLIAFSDPKLEDDAPLQSLLALSAATKIRSVCDLPSVPATRRIALSLREATGAGAGSLFSGADATEARLESLSEQGTLRRARTIAFNTHGITAPELDYRIGEPALALTPEMGCGESLATAESYSTDGLLTASEIIELDLDADWVLLTACNTAASEGTSGAEPLSGLARAFFYAGARELLVSHWPATVSSDPTREGPTELLIGHLFELSASGMTKAIALREAKERVREEYPHPAHWATFSLVGDGL